MKSKVKPVKGSARTKRFDVGGTVGALAGLGTLAYLMSRKKKGADGAEPSKDLLKDAQERAPKQPDTPTADDAGRQRALNQSKDPKSNLVPEGADKDVLYESDKALKRTDDKKAKPGGGTNKPKPRIPPKAQVGNSGQGSSTNTEKSKPTPNMGKDNDARSSRAYSRPEQTPAQAAVVKKEAAKPPEKMAADRSVSEHLANEFKPRSRGEGMKESALRARQDRVRRQVGTNQEQYGMKKGGKVKSASSRADGIAIRGKTRA